MNVTLEDSVKTTRKRTTVQPVKVLHVLEATLGGTMQYLDTIITATRGLNYEFGFAYATLRATPALWPALGKAEEAGWKSWKLEMTRAILPKQDMISALKLAKLMRVFRPDIVHAHSSKAGALSRLAALSLPLHKPKILYSPHAVAANLGKQYLVAEKALAPLTERIICVSDSEAAEITGLGLIEREKADVVYPVVDCDHLSVRDRVQARVGLGLHEDAQIVIGIGRMTGQKNPLGFIDVVEQLNRVVPGVLGLWIGDGELKEEFVQAVHARGLSAQVKVAGWQNDVRPWIAAADVLISTSLYESFGFMVAEALAMERPVVATDVAGTRDIMVGPLADYLYNKGDASGAAQLIAGLLGDPAQRIALGRTGRAMIAKRFSFAAMRFALDSIYSQAARR